MKHVGRRGSKKAKKCLVLFEMPLFIFRQKEICKKLFLNVGKIDYRMGNAKQRYSKIYSQRRSKPGR